MKLATWLGTVAAVGCFIQGGVAAAQDVDATYAAQLIQRHQLLHPEPPSYLGLHELVAWLKGIDPYARLSELESGADSTRLGVEVLDDRGDEPPVILPLSGGVVEWAGLRTPFRLLSVDGEETRGRQGVAILQRAAAAGRAVVLEVRDVDASPETPPHRAAVVRRPHKYLPVEVERINDWHIVRIHRFVRGQTVGALKDALHAGKSRRVLLDLRYATGGNLQEAIEAVALFMPRQVALATTLSGMGDTAYLNQPGQWVTNGPIPVLVGSYTASAAEVFIRALDHWGWGVSAGRTTYGKCLFQQSFVLPSGQNLSFTIGQLLDPANVWCENRGLRPQIPLASPTADTVSQVTELERTLKTRFRVCSMATYRSPGAAEAAAPGMGADDANPGTRAVLMREANGTFRPCLARTLPETSATIVRDTLSNATGASLNIQNVLK